MRHAKSSWDDFNLSDHDRPLMKVGIRKTERIILYLQEHQIKPDLIISSSAKRARETAKLVAGGLNYPKDSIQIDKELYHANTESIFSLLFGVSDEVDEVMIFGHNPTFTYFVNQYMKPEVANMPTSGLVGISFATDHWNEIATAKPSICQVVFPRMLK